jgi:hypothetical protein
MTILEKDGMSTNQFTKLQCQMVLDDTKTMTKDPNQPFSLEFIWIKDWVIKSCVDMEEFFNKIDAEDKSHCKPFPSPLALMKDCIRGVNSCFNNRIILSVFNVGDEDNGPQ